MSLQAIDATVLIALITLFGSIYTIKSNERSEHSKQLLAMLEQSHIEIEELKVQHREYEERLEKKIMFLTNENTELRKEVAKLTVSLLNHGITSE